MQIEVLKAAAAPSGLPCFSIVRNELYFLPHFLAHYRGLGIGHFIFYDDGSTDGTRELLLSQPDCTVLGSDHAFQERMPDGKPFHYHARTIIPERFAPDQWCLVVDADEFLFLPTGFPDLASFVSHLEALGHICVLAPMVDFYPERLELRHYPDELGPFEGCRWWFDRDPGFERNPYNGELHMTPSGVRARMLSMLMERDPARTSAIFNGQAPSYAKLWKIPLIKTGKGLQRLDTHSVDTIPPMDVQLALAHFKFTPATDAKIRDALERKSYFNQSQEYRFLETALEMLAEERLIFDQSVPFEGPHSLEAAGLLFAGAGQGARSAALADQGTGEGGKVASAAQLETLFATPVMVTRFGDDALIAELERAILKRRDEDGGIQRSNLGGWHSDGELFAWGGAPARSLLARIFEMADQQTVLKAEQPGQAFEWAAQGWANVNQPGASNAAHSHPGCFWSAVYYIRVDPGTGGELILHDPRSPALEMYAPSLWFKESGVQREGTIKPHPGLLILFPAWLIHSVRPWFGDGLRISIAINLRVKFLDRGAAAAAGSRNQRFGEGQPIT